MKKLLLLLLLVTSSAQAHDVASESTNGGDTIEYWILEDVK